MRPLPSHTTHCGYPGPGKATTVFAHNAQPGSARIRSRRTQESLCCLLNATGRIARIESRLRQEIARDLRQLSGGDCASVTIVYYYTNTLIRQYAMLLAITPAASTPIYLQIVEQVRRMVAGGQLKPGDELPSVRA